MCGEQCSWWRPGSAKKRSPPRVRGTVPWRLRYPCPSRITPACAGNSCIDPAGIGGIWDHPRVCGEQIISSGSCPPPPGSPPRVRGTAIRRASVIPKTRITPACAGNSAMAYMFNVSAEDHPRVCGEQSCRNLQGPGLPGSPPRVRGTVDPSIYTDLGDRITPACAGNSKCV